MCKQCVMMNGFSIDKCWFNLLPSGVNKPHHALWTSTYKDDPSEIGWIEWCYYNMPDWIQDEMYLITALFFEGVSERKLSEITGIPQKTIDDRKHKILIKLKGFLEN